MKILQRRLQQGTDFRRIAVNTAWLFSDNLIRLIISVLVGAWVARYLGTNDYGKLSLALTYVALGTPLFKLGLDYVVIQHLVKKTFDTGATLGTAFFMRLVSTLIFLTPLYIIVDHLHNNDPIITLLVIILGVGAVFQSLDVVNFWFESQIESRYTVIASNISLVVVSILKVLAVLARLPLIVFGVLYLLDIVIQMGAALFIYLRYQRESKGQRHHWSVNWGYAYNLLKESWPLILSSLAISIYMRIDQVMLAQMLPLERATSAVGIYAVAVRISEIWYFVPSAIVASAFPALLERKQRSIDQYHKRLQQLFRLLVLIGYGGGVLITVFSGVIIEVIYGKDYAGSAIVLAILSWAGIWVSIGLARSQVLIAENKNLFAMYATIFGAVVNVLINLVAIPSMGPTGCAIATFVAYGASAYLSSFALRSKAFISRMQTAALLYPNPFK